MDPPTEQSSRPSSRSALGAVRWLSLCFFLVFSGFNASQFLQATINPDSGALNLTILYFFFTCMLIVAPSIVRNLENSSGGLPWVLCLSSIVYSAGAAVNVFDPQTHPTVTQWLHPISFAALGIAAALLWTSQAQYLGRCALKIRSIPLHAATSACFSEFFQIYQFAGVASSAIAAVTSHAGRAWLFGTLATVAGIGSCLFLGLPNIKVAHRQATPDNPIAEDLSSRSVLSVSLQAAFASLIPLILATGMMYGFYIETFSTIVKSACSDDSLAGPIAFGSFYLVNSFSTHWWGKVQSGGVNAGGQKDGIHAGKRALFPGLMVIAFCVGLVVYERSRSAAISSFALPPLALAVGASAWFAFADAFFESQMPACVQERFQASGAAIAANAGYQFWLTLGIFLEFGLQQIAALEVQAAAVCGMTLVGLFIGRKGEGRGDGRVGEGESNSPGSDSALREGTALQTVEEGVRV